MVPAVTPRTRLSNGSTGTRARRGWSMAHRKCTRWCWRAFSWAKATIFGHGRDVVAKSRSTSVTSVSEAGASADFDTASLARYLHSSGLIDTPTMRVERLAGGQSNPTYLVEAGARRYVL